MSSEDEKDRKKWFFSKILKNTFSQAEKEKYSKMYFKSEKSFKREKRKLREKQEISKSPYKVLEIPGLEDNYYHNIMDFK